MQKRKTQCLQLAAILVATGLLAGCARPAPPQTVDQVKEVSVARTADSVEQTLLTTLVVNGLNKQYRAAAHADQLLSPQELTTGKADVIIGCAGELLQTFNPGKAQELAAEFAAQPEAERDEAEWRETVYAALVGSLPGELAATNPGIVQGCAEQQTVSLPMNLVPLYRKPVLDKGPRDTINVVIGGLKQGSFEQMQKEIASGTDVTGIADEYLAAQLK